MKPPHPDNERTRLASLRQYGVLDTAPEPAFDDLATLASLVCNTPTALITLVDIDRQWFKARVGLDLRETHRDLAFCAHAILQHDLMIVPDAAADPRFAAHPLVVGPPFIRFYAGAPLVTSDGLALGTLAVIDYTPRGLTPTQRGALEALSRQVVGQLELRRRVLREQQTVVSAKSTARRSVNLHRATLDSALDAVVNMDSAGIVREFNAAAERMFGYTRREAVGQRMADLIIPPAAREAHTLGILRYLAGGAPRFVGRRIETAAMRRGGEEFPVELSIERVPGIEPPLFTGFIRDITERRALEEQLRHSQKMEAIGQLAGGVAHDFNNILTVIQSHASLLTTEGGEGDERSDALRQIGDAADRAARLTRQLLAFSRKQVLQPADLDVNDIVANTAQMLRRILGEDIELVVQASPAAALVHGDAGMIEQVLMNLAVNARDAMPSGGRLVIGTSVEPIDEAFLREHASMAQPGRFVRVRVSDTGTGIAREHLPRIFEPFFTTKDVNRGTGLGLATAYGIAKQHGGWIDVQSEVTRGSTFDLYLPATDRRPVAAAPGPPADLVVTGSETILVVEDETPLRVLARTILERHGYRVLDAVDGVTALDVWRAHAREIDLVFTDMVMPEGVSGVELADRMLAERPEIPVVVTSGYSVDMFGKELTPRTQMGFLQKPYKPRQLLETIRRSLDAAAAARGAVGEAISPRPSAG